MRPVSCRAAARPSLRLIGKRFLRTELCLSLVPGDLGVDGESNLGTVSGGGSDGVADII